MWFQCLGKPEADEAFLETNGFETTLRQDRWPCIRRAFCPGSQAYGRRMVTYPITLRPRVVVDRDLSSKMNSGSDDGLGWRRGKVARETWLGRGLSVPGAKNGPLAAGLVGVMKLLQLNNPACVHAANILQLALVEQIRIGRIDKKQDPSLCLHRAA